MKKDRLASFRNKRLSGLSTDPLVLGDQGEKYLINHVIKGGFNSPRSLQAVKVHGRLQIWHVQNGFFPSEHCGNMTRIWGLSPIS